MNKPCFQNYWIDSGSIAYLKELFGQFEIRKVIEALIDGEEIEKGQFQNLRNKTYLLGPSKS